MNTIWIAVDASGLRSILGAKTQAEADAAVLSLDASYPEDAPHRALRYELATQRVGDAELEKLCAELDRVECRLSSSSSNTREREVLEQHRAGLRRAIARLEALFAPSIPSVDAAESSCRDRGGAVEA